MKTKFNKNSNGAKRKNNLIKITLGILVIFSLITCGVSASDQGLVAYWSFDDGTATDEAGNNPFETLVSRDFLVSLGNGGTIHGANVVDGISGKALEFDGVDDYVACLKN